VSARAVFFDFGGTLVRSVPDMLPIFQAAAQRAKVRVAWDAFLRANEEIWQQLWPEAPRLLGQTPSFADRVHRRALERVVAEGSIERMVRCIREEAISPRWHPPFPETELALRKLRARGLSLHVVSNNVDYLPLLLRNLGWSDASESVTFSQELGVSKPDPRIFRHALDRAGCPSDEALYVGDSWESDYVGARGAGIAAVWLNRSGNPPPTACRQVRDLLEFDALFSAKQ
jgi:HAD superfamily hydrolase (TIGR01509 family)